MTKIINYNEVVLVNSNDEVIGFMDKLAAHKSGALHRAFSVFLFNDKGEMLIQKRASSKYHSAGLWSNACCSHPAPNEAVEIAAKRRLKEELFLDADVDFVFSFEYETKFKNQLIENELDHVYVGHSNSRGKINPEEVSALKFIPVINLVSDMEMNPRKYTEWFKIIVLDHWSKISSILDKQKLQSA